MRLFVYGSLKRGYALHDCLAAQEFLGEAVTRPRYRLFDCGDFPGMVPAERNGQTICGEVYSLSAEVRSVLDEVEGVSEGLYTFGPVALAPPFDTESVFAYFYALPTDKLPSCGTSWPRPPSCEAE